jgi:LDH2 family malate/lactate/ureidoglycolate dehydrogenase
MNMPPKDAIRGAPEPMRQFATAVLQNAGLNEEDASLLARLLVLNDLRGVFSHGTRQLTAYVDHFQAGRLNPRPSIRVVSDRGSTVVVDGDGGLGYFPAWRAAHLLAERCQKDGIAAAVTQNHGHIGAAGLYSRVPIEHGQIAYCTSGHELHLSPDQSIMGAAGGSPMSFAVPAGEAPPLVLDFGAMHDLYSDSPHVQELIRLAPGLVFRSLGLGTVCQAVGGLLAGVPLGGPGEASPEGSRRWTGANQGAFMVAVEIDRFLPLERFIAQMEAYVRRAREMQPVPGHEPATLPGGLEWEREREWAQSGIPVGERHRAALARVGEAVGVPPPV